MKRNHTVARYSKITEFDKANISRAFFFFSFHTLQNIRRTVLSKHIHHLQFTSWPEDELNIVSHAVKVTSRLTMQQYFL